MKSFVHQKSTSHQALRISTLKCHIVEISSTQCDDIECHSIECHNAEYHSIECHNAEYRSIECHNCSSSHHLLMDKAGQLRFNKTVDQETVDQETVDQETVDKEIQNQLLHAQPQHRLSFDGAYRKPHRLCRYGLLLSLLFPLVWIGTEASFWVLAPAPAHPVNTPETFIPTPNPPPVFTRGSGTR